MHLPIRARLTIISGALTAAVLIGLGSFVYLRFEADLVEVVDEGLRARADVMLAGADGVVIGVGNPAEPAEALSQLLDVDGGILASTAGVAAPLSPPDGLVEIEGALHYDGEIDTDAGTVPVRLLAVRAADGTLLVVGAALEDTRDALGRLQGLLLVGGPIAVLLASAVGWLVAGAALRPVERLRTEAEAISASEPGRRLLVPPTGDELARLADSLNRMLARLEAALERERQFVSAASHELRTPLANLKAELDIALRRERSPEELAAVLRSASEEADRLTRLSEDLLVLARVQEGALGLRRETVDLGVLVSDTVSSFGGRAESLGVALELATPAEVRSEVDPARLRQAVGNLIDNALRHTPAGGQVSVELARDGNWVVIAVTDTGAGFGPAEADRAFEPFARSDAARSRSAGGSGLGLAIVSAVATAHGGTAEATDRPEGGARVAIRFPA
jgi:heavy metal sensor kinase